MGNPESAFVFGQLPGDASALSAWSSWSFTTGVRPKAMRNYDTFAAETKTLIDAEMKGYCSPRSSTPRRSSRVLPPWCAPPTPRSSSCASRTSFHTCKNLFGVPDCLGGVHGVSFCFFLPCANFRSRPSAESPLFA